MSVSERLVNLEEDRDIQRHLISGQEQALIGVFLDADNDEYKPLYAISKLNPDKKTPDLDSDIFALTDLSEYPDLSKRGNIDVFADKENVEIRVIDGHDHAIVGLTISADKKHYHAVYSTERIVALLMSMGMDCDEAYEFYSFNIEGAKFSGSNPFYVNTLEDEFELSEEYGSIPE